MDEKEIVDVNGQFLHKSTCLLSALMIQEHRPMVWDHLARNLEITGRSATLNKVKYMATECFVKALYYNKKSSETWHRLGLNLVNTQKKTIQVGRNSMSAKDCFIKAIELNPRNSKYWQALGDEMLNSEIIEVLNIQFTKIASYQRSILLNSSNAIAWTHLSQTIQHKDDLVNLNGTSMNRIDCQVKSLLLDNERPDSWINLGKILSEKQSVIIEDQLYDSKKCYIKAIELDEKYLDAWNNLGALLLPGETVDIHGKLFSEKDCYIKALSLDLKNENVLRNMRYLPRG